MDVVGRFEDIFTNAAIAKDDGCSSDDARLFDTMKDAFIRLKNHPSGNAHISKLLQHKNNWVKMWVASQVLSEGQNSEAEKVLNLLSKESGVLGFDAKMVLEQYQNGALQCPFGIKP